MYKTSTFITSLFCKFQLKDKNIRKSIVSIYSPLIEAILFVNPPARRVLLFKQLLPVIQCTIKYLEKSKKSDTPELIRATTNFSLYLIKEIGLKDVSADKSTFNNIMNQLNIGDIACDIGQCIKKLKKDPADDEILSQLEVLLHDYNTVTGNSLTPAALLEE